MKVLLINGSPHKKGCTYTGLTEIAKTLETHGISSEIIWLGNAPLSGCIGCGACYQKGECFMDDAVNAFAPKAAEADAFVFGSPVHYAAASGAITSFMDRLFYAHGAKLAYKPAAAILSCRRGGATAAFDQLNKYFTINNMPIVSSQYWNMIHGHSPEEVVQDLEGMQIMRTLAHNMAWLLECIAAGKAAGVAAPVREPFVRTNFIR